MSQAEYTISYAYPSSPDACALKRGAVGCLVLQADGAATPHDSFANALSAASALAGKPSRWSHDHPLNARFIVGGDESAPSSLSDMLQANATDEGLCDWLKQAKPGDRFPDGEGCDCVSTPAHDWSDL